MRRKKKETTPVSPEEKLRLKKVRQVQRREARKLNKRSKQAAGDNPERTSTGPLYSDPTYQRDDFEWIRAGLARAYASKILNDHKDYAYWLSIPHAKLDGNPPTAHFHPCRGFRTAERVYYGFVFREHRDMAFKVFRKGKGARKETHHSMIKVRGTAE